MTEPAVASSDATNIQASIVRSEMSSCNNSASYHEQESSQLTRNLFDLVSNVHRDGDEYVLNGRKWWTSNGMDPRSQSIKKSPFQCLYIAEQYCFGDPYLLDMNI